MSLSRISGVSSATGVVRAQDNYEVIPGATIELITNTGPTGTYYQADNNGAFVVPTYGVYGLKITSAEFAPVTIAPESVGENMAVYMVRNSGDLPGITITAPKKNNWMLWLGIAGLAYYAYKKRFLNERNSKRRRLRR